MFWTKIKRVVRSGFIYFWRNAFVSLTSVLVMTITLFVIGSVVFTNATLSTSLDHIKNRVDVNVYFATSAGEEDVLAIKKSLENLPEVSRVEYISREQVLENFKKKHENDEITLQALEELKENPLGAVINVKAKETSQYESIAKFLEGNNALSKEGASIIDEVNYFENKVAIDKLTRIIDSGQKLGFAATIILVVISILITFNTIRLAIYTSREEISVMKLVGASNTYIRGPFVVVGIMYGTVAAIVSLMLFYPLTFWLGERTEQFFSGMNVFEYYVANFGEIFFLLLGSGILVGAVSSYLAVKRHLKV